MFRHVGEDGDEDEDDVDDDGARAGASVGAGDGVGPFPSQTSPQCPVVPRSGSCRAEPRRSRSGDVQLCRFQRWGRNGSFLF